MTKDMKRPLLILLLYLLLGCLMWVGLKDAPMQELPQNAKPSAPVSETAKFALPESKITPPAPKAQTPPVDAETMDPTRFRRAYMLNLDAGKISLVDSEDVEGDFAPDRRPPEAWSGMLRCRLLSESNAVLAEELLPAPDHLCAVLDPKSGSSEPVKFTVAQPVLFQLRLPRIKQAVRLDIYRIIQPSEPVLEGLLGSIPLTPP